MPRRYTFRDRQRLERAADHYLCDCYRKRTAARVSEFATFLQLSQQYLSRVTPEIVGMSVRDFLRQRQLTYAADLLARTPLAIQEIALASAFGTTVTFHRCFLAAYGKTPGKYRREVTKCYSEKNSEAPATPAHPERRLKFD